MVGVCVCEGVSGGPVLTMFVLFLQAFIALDAEKQ